MAGRLTIALYNAYDPRRFHEAHRRALARAAPLALAFDANLATLGFPFDDLAGDVRTDEEAPDLRTPQSIAAFVASTTTIGAGGAYFRDLAEAGRFQVLPFPDPGFAPQLGRVVLTTSKADPGKRITPREVASDLLRGASTTLVFGLGPRGVPSGVHDRAPRHLDVTDGGLSLETATALGAVTGAVHAWREALGSAGRASKP